MGCDCLPTVDTCTINKDNKILDMTINSKSIFSFVRFFCAVYLFERAFCCWCRLFSVSMFVMLRQHSDRAHSMKCERNVTLQFFLHLCMHALLHARFMRCLSTIANANIRRRKINWNWKREQTRADRRGQKKGAIEARKADWRREGSHNRQSDKAV